MYLLASDARKSTASVTSSACTHGTGIGVRLPTAAASEAALKAWLDGVYA